MSYAPTHYHKSQGPGFQGRAKPVYHLSPTNNRKEARTQTRLQNELLHSLETQNNPHFTVDKSDIEEAATKFDDIVLESPEDTESARVFSPKTPPSRPSTFHDTPPTPPMYMIDSFGVYGSSKTIGHKDDQRHGFPGSKFTGETLSPSKSMPRSAPRSFTFQSTTPQQRTKSPRQLYTPSQPQQQEQQQQQPFASPHRNVISSERSTDTAKSPILTPSPEAHKREMSTERRGSDETKSGRSFMNLVRNFSVKRQKDRKKLRNLPSIVSQTRSPSPEPEWVATRLEKKSFDNGIVLEKVDIDYDWFPTDEDQKTQMKCKAKFDSIATIIYCEDDSPSIFIKQAAEQSNIEIHSSKTILKNKFNLSWEKEYLLVEKMDNVLPESIMKMTEYRVNRSGDPEWRVKCADYRREQVIKSSSYSS